MIGRDAGFRARLARGARRYLAAIPIVESDARNRVDPGMYKQVAPERPGERSIVCEVASRRGINRVDAVVTIGTREVRDPGAGERRQGARVAGRATAERRMFGLGTCLDGAVEQSEPGGCGRTRRYTRREPRIHRKMEGAHRVRDEVRLASSSLAEIHL